MLFIDRGRACWGGGGGGTRKSQVVIVSPEGLQRSWWVYFGDLLQV